MLIETLRSATSARLVVIAIDATLWTAASAFSNPRIGLLVVCDENNKATGVVSKSDIVRYLTDVGVTEAPVANLMSRNIVWCRPEDDLYATWQRMAARRRAFRICRCSAPAATPLGVLDVRDALKVLFEQEEYQEQLLINYVAGVGYQ